MSVTPWRPKKLYLKELHTSSLLSHLHLIDFVLEFSLIFSE